MKRHFIHLVLVLSLPFRTPTAGTPFPPGTPTIPLGQLQQHSLTLQGQPGQTLSSATATQTAQGQQTVFRLPTAVSLTGKCLRLQPRLIQMFYSPLATTSYQNQILTSLQIATCLKCATFIIRLICQRSYSFMPG